MLYLVVPTTHQILISMYDHHHFMYIGVSTEIIHSCACNKCLLTLPYLICTKYNSHWFQHLCRCCEIHFLVIYESASFFSYLRICLFYDIQFIALPIHDIRVQSLLPSTLVLIDSRSSIAYIYWPFSFYHLSLNVSKLKDWFFVLKFLDLLFVLNRIFLNLFYVCFMSRTKKSGCSALLFWKSIDV